MNQYLIQWKTLGLAACALVLAAQLQAQDAPTPVRLVATDPSALAGTTGGAFTLIRYGDTNNSLSVTVDISGTAANGVDYGAIANVITLPPGYYAVDIPVQPIVDTVNRGNKTVVLTLETNDAYRIRGNPKATVKIVDDIFDIPPPTVSLSSPSEGDVFTTPATVTVSADVSDPDLAIASVSFFENDTLIGRVTNSPYSLVWTKSQAGKYALFARAEDQFGKSAVSVPVHVTLSATPVVTLTTDAPSYSIGQTVTLLAQIGDPNEAIKSVSFSVNNKVIGTVTSPPFTLSWLATTRGTFTNSAVAVDQNTGKKGSSAKVLVTVTPNAGN